MRCGAGAGGVLGCGDGRSGAQGWEGGGSCGKVGGAVGRYSIDDEILVRRGIVRNRVVCAHKAV